VIFTLLAAWMACQARVSIEESLRRHNDCIQAKATLRSLSINERLLNRVWFFDGPQSLKGEISGPATAFTGVMQERLALPFTVTVKATH
jgi:hypothetical protein